MSGLPPPDEGKAGSTETFIGPVPSSGELGAPDDPDTVEGAQDASTGGVPSPGGAPLPTGAPASSGAPALSGAFGRYRIVRQLGSGGMGTVYLAHDSQLDRQVALKVPQFRGENSAESAERFLREARSMATLRHPHLCPVFDAGDQDGVQFLTMAYIEGELLSERLKQSQAAQGLAPAEAVDLVHKLALALEEAHRAGIIHRDLKPSNIMIDRRGEPVVMDFGLAHRDRDDQVRLTEVGAVVGTPAYIPPEFLEQGDAELGPAADVYSLGVIFYQLLCGQLPFRGSLAAILTQIVSSAPRRPSEIRDDLDPALEEICLQAMARHVKDRYPTMGAFAAALEAYRLGVRETLLNQRRERAASRAAWTPKCAHDLFIGYALVDDEPPPGVAAAGWVTTLAEHLEWRLRQLCGKSEGPSIWMEHHLSGSPRLEPLLAERLAQTAVVILVTSPGSLASEWCVPGSGVLELLRNRPGRAGNILVVERDRIDSSALPAELAETRSFQFWGNRDGRGPVIYGHPRPRPEVDLEYYAKVDDLARGIKEALTEAGRESPAAVSAPSNAALSPVSSRGAESKIVYLAEVTDDLDPLRDGVKRSLDQIGFRVVPQSWLPREVVPFRAAVDEALQEAVLFVQLLGPLAGKRPPGGGETYAALQSQGAQAAGMPIVQWRDPALDPRGVRDSEHRALLEGTAVLAIDFEDFKRETVRRAEREWDRRYKTSQPSVPADRAFVFVNVDRGDLPLAHDLCELLEQSGCSYALPMHEGRPDEIRRDLEANLIDCDGLIVIYGEITEQWVREQLRQWRKMLYLRERPLRALAVFEGPPPDKHAVGMRLAQMHVIDCREGLQEDKIRAFLDALAGNVPLA